MNKDYFGGSELNLQTTQRQFEYITIPQYVFIIGLFVKQFYLLPSGSIQIGDLILIFGCILNFFFTKRGRLTLDKTNLSLIIYILFITVINVLYYLFMDDQSFIKPIFYYVYNLVVVLSFSSFLNMDNSKTLLKKLGVVLKVSLVLQLVLLLTGLGRWAYSTRYSGTFNDPNQYSVFIFFSLLLVYMINQGTDRNNWKIWYVLGTMLVIPSASTGTMLGLVIFWAGLYLINVKELKRITKILWCGLLCILITLFAFTFSNNLPLPDYITTNSMYVRVINKTTKIANSSDNTTLLADRGWTRIMEYPEFFLFGAGEGGFERFNTWLEIHSSLIGPLFYYGIVPFFFSAYWIWRNVKNTYSFFIYAALFSEAIFLVNTRQPLYWMLIAIGSYPALKRNICSKITK